MENLYYFLKVCECKSFTAASEELHLSQAALSSSIKKLEDSLNAQLFIRHRRGVYLTELGELIFPHIEKIVAEYHIVEQLCSEQKVDSIQIEKINILTHPFIADTCLSELAISIVKNYPEYHIQIRESSVEGCLSEIKKQNYDLIILPVPEPIKESIEVFSNEYRMEKLGTDYLAIEMHNTHPLAKKNTISLRDLMNTNIVFINQNNKKDASVASYYFDINHFKYITEIDNMILYRKYIENGFVAFTFNNLRKNAFSFFNKEKNIIVKKLNQKNTFTYYVFYKSNDNPLIALFMEKLLNSNYFKF